MTRAERIFHIATHEDWSRALRTGRYTTSTRGRTLGAAAVAVVVRRRRRPTTLR